MTALPLLTDPSLPDVETGAGILTCAQGNLPLTAMDVDARLAGLVAGMTVRQTFRNPHRTPIEATYIFPLPSRAAVTGLTVTIGDRRIIGELQERQAARDAYDAAIEAGQRATILEEERPDTFTTRIGNLAPGEEATIELALAGSVPCELGTATFRVPLVVAPRYISGAPLEGASVGDGVALDTDAVPDASRITPPVLLPGWANPVRLSVSVAVDPGGLEMSGLQSSLHAVTVAGELPGPVTVELRPGNRLDRDFVLRYRVGSSVVGVGAVAVPDGEGSEGTFVVTVTPPATTATPAPRDVVLLLDRSGSMTGWKMVAARRAAARIIDALTSADRFAVMAFDNVVEQPPAPDGLVGLAPATDRNRYRAVEWLARLEARGGTEMLPPLALARQTVGAGSSDRYACCILITDGQVGNEDQLVAAAQGLRLFTVGIDQAVNAGLLHRLAALNGGHCELVESEDRLDQVMTGLRRSIGNPAFTDVRLAFDGLDVVPDSVTPPGPVDVLAGVPLVVTGRFRGRPEGRVVVVVVSAGARREFSAVGVTLGVNPAAAAVWARGHLRDLEDRYVAGNGGEELAAQIVATSLRHRVLCRFTAFVAVDEAGVAVSGDLHRIVQPVERPAGWAAAPLRQSPWVGPPQPAPGYQAPAPVPGQAQPYRAGRRALAATGKPLAIPRPPAQVEILPERYRERLEALLDATDGLRPGDTLGDVVDDARLLADEVGPGPIAEMLDALAAALSIGDLAAAIAVSDRLRDEIGARPEPRRRFWR